MKNYKKTEHFEPIAMKCTEEQFNELKPILDKYIEDIKYSGSGFQFKTYPYITNYSCEEQNRFNTRPIEFLHSSVKIIETFNAETFLKACGIVEVEKTYKLSETFVKELCKEPNIREGIIENDKLEVNRWYKANSGSLGFNSANGNYYGFNADGKYVNDRDIDKFFEFDNTEWNWTLATPQEVETALIREAKKRGYVYGISIVDIYNGTSDKYLTIVSSNRFIYETIKCGKNKGQMSLRDSDGNLIFHNGVWAEIIDETIEIKKSVILNTPNDLELGQLIRKMV